MRRKVLGVALALAGVVAAAAIGLAVNTISGDSVGLSAEPLSAGTPLAPEAAERDPASDRQDRNRNRNRGRGGDDDRAADSRGETTTAAPGPVPETVPDDNGGERDEAEIEVDASGGSDDSGSGSDNSGSGSDNSGSGSDNSGSGSDSSGSGSGGDSGDD